MNIHTKSLLFTLMFPFILILTACKEKETSEPTNTYLLQARAKLPVLETIKKKIALQINEIIKKEVGPVDLDFFVPKRESQGLTLYYFNDLHESGKPLLFSIFEHFKKNHASLKLDQVTLAQKIDFFGKDHDELVILVHDPGKELSALNKELEEAAYKANDEYKRSHQTDLYSVAKSKEFSFLPHIGLGRIRLSSIKQHIKDKTQLDATIDRIRTLIKQVVLDEITKELTPENHALTSFSYCIFSPTNRSFIE